MNMENINEIKGIGEDRKQELREKAQIMPPDVKKIHEKEVVLDTQECTTVLSKANNFEIFCPRCTNIYFKTETTEHTIKMKCKNTLCGNTYYLLREWVNETGVS